LCINFIDRKLPSNATQVAPFSEHQAYPKAFFPVTAVIISFSPSFPASPSFDE